MFVLDVQKHMILHFIFILLAINTAEYVGSFRSIGVCRGI